VLGSFFHGAPLTKWLAFRLSVSLADWAGPRSAPSTPRRG
jgi:hypothetical protein